MDTFNEILKFFIEKRIKIYNIDGITIPGLDQNQILQVIENVPAFFQSIKIGNQTIIKIYIDIKACGKYNSSIYCNHDQCQELHICKQKFLNSKCTNDSCKLNHTLEFFQTKNILINLKINGNLNLISKFFRIFSGEEEDTLNIIKNTLIINNSKNSKSANFILLKNVPKDKTKTDTLRYGAIIAKLTPSKSILIDKENGIWHVQFDNQKDRTELEKNFELVKKDLPSAISIDTSYDENLFKNQQPLKIDQKCPKLTDLTDCHTNVEEDTKKKRNTKESIKSESIQLPQISYVTYKSLYFSSIERIKKKYCLEDYSIDRDFILSITGTVINVNKSIELVNKISNCIRVKKIDGMSINFFKCTTLPQITEDLLFSLVDKLFTVEVKLIDGPNLPGFYVSYIQNLEELECPNDSVFDQACKFIKENLDFEEINVTNYSDVFNSEKWEMFKRNNLLPEIMGSNFWMTVYAGLSNQNFVMICGKKDYVQANKLKIETFLTNNEKNTLEIPLDLINAEFIKLTSSDELKNIEKKYEVKIDVICDQDGMNSKIVVKNHPKKSNQNIEQEINILMRMRQKGVILSEFLPSFDKLLNDKKIGIQNAIRNIQDQTKTVIECSAIMQEEAENLNIQAENLQINEKKSDLMDSINNSYFSAPSGNQNKLLTVLKIGNSVLKLEVGCITKTKADVIVSTNSKSLNLGSGVLSKLLIQAAGNSVILEARKKYPNGIDNNSIAITNAGSISGVKYLYHAALSHFESEKHAFQAIESIINASFIELTSNGLTSISFPALGAGGFGYPSNFVSKQMIECISNFLELSTNSLNVNIVLDEKKTELIKIFENEFLSCQKPHLKKMDSEDQKLKDLNHKISFSNLKAKGKFTIYFKSNKEYNAAHSQLKVFIADEFKRENLNETNMKNLTSLSVKDLQELFVKFPDIEIVYENKILILFGYKNIVWSAKAELAGLINNKMAGHFSSMIEQMKVSTDNQWQFLTYSNDWKSFSVYLNSLIESNYLKKESQVNFDDENNQNGTIFFNMEPMVYLINQTRINVRRIDIAKLGKDSIDLPSNWISTNSGNDFDLIDLKTDSHEFQNVFNHFISKLQNNSVTISKIQRVQNKYLFKQFQIFKERFNNEKKNPNEMTLFHGSTEDSLLKICRFGFNRSFCGINGVAFGQGVYFAVNSSYSLNYSSRGHQTQKCMIQAKVLVGQSCLGNRKMKVPPTQPNTLIPFDSTCDLGKSIFVCYHDNQCYPEYLIYFI